MCRADNLNTFMSRLSQNLGGSGPVIGLYKDCFIFYFNKKISYFKLISLSYYMQ